MDRLEAISCGKAVPCLPAPSRSMPGPGPRRPAGRRRCGAWPRRAGRTDDSLDRASGSVGQHGRPVLPPSSRVPMDAGSGNRTVTRTGAGDHGRRSRGNRREQEDAGHPPGRAGRDRDQRHGRLPQGRPPPGEGKAARAVPEATGRMHRALLQSLHDRGLKVVVANPRQSRDLPRAGGEPAKADRAGARVPAALRAAFPDMAATAPADGTVDRLRDMPVLREAPVDRRAGPRRSRARPAVRTRTGPSRGSSPGPAPASPRPAGGPRRSSRGRRAWRRAAASGPGAGHRPGHGRVPGRPGGRAGRRRQPPGRRPGRRRPLRPRRRHAQGRAPRHRRAAASEGRPLHGGDGGLHVRSRHEGDVRPAPGKGQGPQGRRDRGHAEARRDRERPSPRPAQTGGQVGARRLTPGRAAPLRPGRFRLPGRPPGCGQAVESPAPGPPPEKAGSGLDPRHGCCPVRPPGGRRPRDHGAPFGRCDVPEGGTRLKERCRSLRRNRRPAGRTPCPGSPEAPSGRPGVPVFLPPVPSTGPRPRAPALSWRTARRHQRLPGQRHDPALPRPPVAGDGAAPGPLRQRAPRLVPQPAPGHLHEVLSQHRAAGLAGALVVVHRAARGAACRPPCHHMLTSGRPFGPNHPPDADTDQAHGIWWQQVFDPSRRVLARAAPADGLARGTAAGPVRRDRETPAGRRPALARLPAPQGRVDAPGPQRRRPRGPAPSRRARIRPRAPASRRTACAGCAPGPDPRRPAPAGRTGAGTGSRAGTPRAPTSGSQRG